MRKGRIIALSVSLALILCLGMGSLAMGWVAHGTPNGEHWSGEDVKFRSMAILYYQNNTQYSIQLLKTNHWLWNTGVEDIQYGTCKIYEGDGSQAYYRLFWWYDPIEPGEMRSNWYQFEPGRTYDKEVAVMDKAYKPVLYGGTYIGGWQINIFPTHFEDDPYPNP